MSLFTGKGDDGTTYKFGCDQRFSKSDSLAEALGTLDEVNSYLGVVKVNTDDRFFIDILDEIQQNLFIIQAQVAGADKKIDNDKVEKMSEKINNIEKELPPITTFFVSGGCELSSHLDFARTIARRAERRVVKVVDEKIVKLDTQTLAYLNRLSSMVYALARLANHKSGVEEEKPTYE